MVGKQLLWLLVVILCWGGSVTAAPEQEIVTMANDFIEIVVNAREQNTGRFSVNTTGGDPYRQGDEDKPLIYGGYNPWTSYTTVRIDDQNYIFGGPTQTRAGKSGNYGEVTKNPAIVGNQVRTVSSLDGIEVTQNLGFTRSPSTGLADTARIEYTLKNVTDEPKRVGLRVVIDTMLGANDGAPFRVEEEKILYDRIFQAAQMPTFWQAFDSLADPQVTAQGTLKGGEVSTPDQVFFTNWGSLADGPWDFDYRPGRDFTRTGEFELDSALALRWEGKSLSPGEERVYVAYYGLGGITIAPGELSIGVTSPASVIAGRKGMEPFPIVAYVENSGTGEARDVVISIDAGDGLRLIEGDMEKDLGHLVSKASTQMKWTVIPTIEKPGELSFTINVRSSNSEPNLVTRKIQVVAPPEIKTSLQGPLGLGIKNDRWDPVPFQITATLTNVGGADAYRVQTSFNSPVLRLAGGDSASKYVGNMEPGEETKISWSLRPAGFTGHLPYSVKSQAINVEESLANNFILIPMLRPHVRVSPPILSEGRETLVAGDFFTVEVVATNIPYFYGAEMRIGYDPTAVEIVGGTLGIDRGTLFVNQVGRRSEYLQWGPNRVIVDDGIIQLTGNRYPHEDLLKATGTLGTIRLRALRNIEKTPIIIRELKITDKDGNPIKVEAVDSYFKIFEDS